jgi:YVTN family beta-propeller protein
VSIGAASQADPFKSGSASLGVLAFAAATLTSIYPTTGAQGALLEDVYLTGTNFISTTDVRFNGVVIPKVFTNPTLMRVRVPAALLASAGTFPVDVQDQGGTPTAPVNFTVTPVRPALIGTSVDSVAQSGATSVNLHGGFYGSAASPAVQAEFNGNVQAASITDSRTLDLTFNAPAVGGLYSLAVRNPAATVPLATANLAVQPTVGPAVLATIPVGANPSAVAVNIATGVAVVANRGDNTVSLIDLASNTVTNTIPVGTAPMGVAVDSERNVAIVVNNGSNDISIINLATASVVATLASPTTPGAAGSCQPALGADPAIANQTVRAVAVNPLTGLALVANACANAATVVDLNTNTIAGTVTGTSAGLGIGTGANTAVAVEPRLDWAILTPGGAGSVAIVDLTRRSVVANFTLPTTFRGIAMNSESARALVTDPTSSNAQLFSLTDQLVTPIPLPSIPAAGTRMVAAAVNPFTNIGVVLTDSANAATLIDLGTPGNPAPVSITTGTTPVAIAMDPGSNTALVANTGSNDVTVIGLGAIRPLHVAQVAVPLGAGPAPGTVLASASPLAITVTGSNFTGGSTVRLDETPIATTFVSSRRLTATVPAGMLTGPRRFAVDVLDGATRSNASELTVIQAVNLTGGGAGCASGPRPRAVAIDGPRDFALVAKSCANELDIIDMNTGTVLRTVTVGTAPEAVAAISRVGRALVANRGNSSAADTVSLVDTVAGTVSSSITVGDEPIGIAVNEDTGVAVVANANSNNLSIFDGIAGGAVTPFTTNQRPLSVAIDPRRNYAAIAVANGNLITVLDLGAATGNVTLVGSTPGVQLPTGVVFDPVADRFLAISSLQNLLYIINPDTRQATSVRLGINPTSLAANFNSSTVVTVNTISNSLSVMDYQDTAGTPPIGSRRIRAIFNLAAAGLNAVAIHPRTNIAAIVDETNNRLLLFPLPR